MRRPPRHAHAPSLRRARGNAATQRPCGLPEPLESRTLFAAGDLDPAFGPGGPDGNGIVTTHIAADDAALTVLVQPDNKILVGGTSNGDFAVARYNPDGSLDLSFGGGDGVVTTSFGDADTIQSLALAPDGRIIAVGSTGVGSATDFAIARYTAGGVLDTTFAPGDADGDGKLTTDFFGRLDVANGVTVDGTGRIVVTGTATGQSTQIAVVRLTPDGAFDPGFDGDGKAFLDFFEGSDAGSEVKVLADNKVLVVGASAPPGQDRRFVLARLNPDGSTDGTFGSGGKATADFGGDAFAKDVAVEPGSGGYVVGGLVDAPGGAAGMEYAVARFKADGTLDTGFGSGGYSVAPGVAGSPAAHYGLARQGDGKLLFGGLSIGGTGGNSFGVARFNADGTPDTTFGSGGAVRTTVPGATGSGGADLALQADGRIVMAGDAAFAATGSDFAVVRYLNNVSAPGSIAGTVFDDTNGNGVRDAGEPGLSGWTVYQDRNNNGSFDAGAASAASTDVPKAIPDDKTPITSDLIVSGVADGITDVNVTLTIEHTYDPDLTVTLISPNLTRVVLFDNVGTIGGTTGNANFDGTTLDDQAAVPVSAGRPPFRGSYRPQELLASLNGQAANGKWQLEIRDSAADDVGRLVSWSLTFATRAEPGVVTAADGSYSFPNLPPGSYTIREVAKPGYGQTAPVANGGAHVINLAEGQAATGRDFGNFQGTLPPAVVGRHAFYNNSAFDGRNAGANDADLAAIATDKEALLPGQTATFNNVTSYTKGLNGIIVELRNLPAETSLTAADFQFRAGNTTDPALWTSAPVPVQVVTLRSAIPEAPARVHVTFADGAVVNRWLQVTVRKTANSRLGADDVFYFGNLVGETGDQPSRLVSVSERDYVGVRRNMLSRNVGPTNHYDFDRDRDVDAFDALVLRRNLGARLSAFGGPDGAAPAAASKPQVARVWSEEPVSVL